MGFNFRKSFRIGKFLRINLSKSGIGWSVGRKGVRYTHSATGRRGATLSLPGTGLSYTVPLGKQKKVRGSAKDKGKKRTESAAPEAVAANLQTISSVEQPASVPISYCPTAGEGVINTTAFHASGTAASAAAAAAPAPTPAEQAATAGVTVFFSATGKCYHYKPCCSGHSYTRSSTEEEALRTGRFACSRCGGGQ